MVASNLIDEELHRGKLWVVIRLLTFKVDDTLFRLVENLEAWNSLPWGEHLWCHLYDEIKNLKQRHSDEHYYGLKKDRNYVPTYTLSGFMFAFQHVPRAPPIKEQHSLFETYLAKLEKACKRRKTGFMVSSIGGTSDNSVKKKWLNDLVIMELNSCVFKLETIIQVICMASDLYDSLNSMFADLIQQHDSDEDISQDYLREEELRLCLEDEEMLRCEHEKIIVEENRFRLDEANRLRLEEENMLHLEEQKKNKRKEFMNSSHGKSILVKLAPAKRNQLGSSSEKINSKIEIFWLKLVCLDPARKGWLTEEHIDLWVDYMWHIRTEHANWAMVSCYFVQLLLQKGLPLFYANGERYTAPWSEVDQVFIPINETGEHWCLAQFHILSGEVTFYDTGYTYDYDYRD
ncbi:phospholipase-like protein, partial [Tanacetum coccineum]